jgi:SAM-dependent methyltransferase
MTRKRAFLIGLFILCACVLMLQIAETRILSVVSYYHLAFFAISMAMFGMTAGSLVVYFNQAYFTSDRLVAHLSWITCAFALTIGLSLLILTSTVLITPADGPILSAVHLLNLIAALVPPYVFAGMGISAALTRSPWSVGVVYASDLGGAAFGCLGILTLLSTFDALSAMLIISALGAIAAFVFALGCNADEFQAVMLPSWAHKLHRPGILALLFAILALGNVAIHPHGLVLSFAKGAIERPGNVEWMQWNSYSRVRAEKTQHRAPELWGSSPIMPPVRVDERDLTIDGGAATPLYAFAGDLHDVDFLKYDITSLAYSIRNRGRAAVIGVGGGRDILAAYLFGFRDVTGIELNSIFINLLTGPFREFSRLAELPGVHFEIDDARSWFASGADSRPGFDLVQMSMVDTWAATAAGAFSLSENGLYTVQGWRHFLRSLTPDGVFTVSRWYGEANPIEIGRLLSLAKAALVDIGIKHPERHLFLASTFNLATLIITRAPLSGQDLTKLRETVERLRFSVLVSPDQTVANEKLEKVMEAPGLEALEHLSAELYIDVTPPTDDRPFFFNQLRLADPAAMVRALKMAAGVNKGNLWATVTLLIIIILSLILLVLTIIIPTLPSTRQAPVSLTITGTCYFLLIGIGFMFVEIALIQRLSLFLGHPVYGLAVGLFALILSTGIGSLLSGLLLIDNWRRAVFWSFLTAIYLALLPFWLPIIVDRFEIFPILARASAAVLMIAPAGVLMGFGFPTGMRLVNGIDSRPTPWFWAINGAAGVLAASIAVSVNIVFSINASLWISAVCYCLVGIAAIGLVNETERSRTASMVIRGVVVRAGIAGSADALPGPNETAVGHSV